MTLQTHQRSYYIRKDDFAEDDSDSDRLDSSSRQTTSLSSTSETFIFIISFDQ